MPKPILKSLTMPHTLVVVMASSREATHVGLGTWSVPSLATEHLLKRDRRGKTASDRGSPLVEVGLGSLNADDAEPWVWGFDPRKLSVL